MTHDEMLELDFFEWFGFEDRPNNNKFNDISMCWADSIDRAKEPAQVLFGPYAPESAIDDFLISIAIDVNQRTTDFMERIIKEEFSQDPLRAKKIISKMFGEK